jgi:putrescine transport system ATP-binding protein
VNILTGRVTDREAGRIALDHVGEADLGHAAEAPEGATVELGIRPEKILIERANGDEPTPNRLYGRIEDIAYLGNTSVFHVRLAGGGMIQVQRTNRFRAVAEAVTWDDAVRLSWDGEALVELEPE